MIVLLAILFCPAAVALTGSTASCHEHLIAARRAGLEPEDGLYSITYGGRYQQVYCDMTRDGGGWTLIVYNRGGRGWNSSNVYQYNPEYPDFSRDYSILSLAEGIKRQSTGAFFEYRIAALQRRRWGGIWRAPRDYVLNSTDYRQTDVQLVKTFDAWDPRRCCLFTRVPWLNLEHPSSLLYAGAPYSTWWGTMIMKGESHEWGRYGPAPYMYSTCLTDGGWSLARTWPIFYWLRESYADNPTSSTVEPKEGIVTNRMRVTDAATYFFLPPTSCESGACLNNNACMGVRNGVFYCNCSSNITEEFCQEPAVSCQDFLKRATKVGLRPPDGIYNISYQGQHRQVYCDMTQDGGGWTLVMYNKGGRGWTRSNVYQYNPEYPDFSRDYSILNLAEGIKRQSTGSFFEYRIAAYGRRRWGGIWRAPREYVINGTDYFQLNVQQIKTFDAWNPDWCCLFNRVPWLNFRHQSSLLNSGPPGSTWWGSLNMRGDSSEWQVFGPAPYIYSSCRTDGGDSLEHTKPIYYWLREQYDDSATALPTGPPDGGATDMPTGRATSATVPQQWPPSSQACKKIRRVSPQNIPVHFKDSLLGTAESDLACFTNGVPLGRASCQETADGAEWIDVSWTLCPLENDTVYTQALRELAGAVVTPGCATRASHNLSVITRGVRRFSVADVTYSVKAVENIAESSVCLEQTTSNMVEAISNLMDATPDTLDAAKSSNRITNMLLDALEEMSCAASGASDSFLSIVQRNIAVLSVPLGYSNVVGFGVRTNEERLTENSVVTFAADATNLDSVLYLPVPELIRKFGKDIRAQFVAYRTNVLFSPQGFTNSSNLSALVIAGSISGHKVENLQAPIILKFRSFVKLQDANKNIYCVFWNLSKNSGNGAWSDSGCSHQGTDGDYITCHCSHLTNFAVLIDWQQTDYSVPHQTALTAITMTGLSVSSGALLLSLIIILVIPRLRKERRYKIVFNLALCLLGANLLILLGLERTEVPLLCDVTAALLHYSLLAAFCWMFVQVFFHYLCFVRVLPLTTSHFVLKVGIPAYGVPSCIVALVAAFDFSQFGSSSPKYCWLGQEAFRYAFMLPIILIVCVNLGLFIRVLHSVWHQNLALRSNQNPVQRRRLQVTASAACFVVTGLTWTFAFLALAEVRLVFQYLFCVFSSLQGLFIFILHIASDRRTRQDCCNWLKEKHRQGVSSSNKTSSVDMASKSSPTSHVH